MQWDYDRNAFILEHKVKTEFPAHARPFRKYMVQRKRFTVPVGEDLDVDASMVLPTFEAARSMVLPFRDEGPDCENPRPTPAMVAKEAPANTAHEASEVGAQGALSLNDEEGIPISLPALRKSL